MSDSNGPYWYSSKTIAEIVDEYGRVRGDLTEQYARDQLTRIIEGRIAQAKADALREAADDMEQFEPFPGEEPDWLRERADQLGLAPATQPTP